jgi:hypothetical protein
MVTALFEMMVHYLFILIEKERRIGNKQIMGQKKSTVGDIISSLDVYSLF